MKKFLTYGLILFSLGVFGQGTANLDADNGIFGLRLLEDLDTIPGFVTIFNDPDALGDKYEYAMLNSQYSYADTVIREFAGTPVLKILLLTHGAYIIEIRVVCAFDSTVLKTVESMYGLPTTPYILNKDYENKKAAWAFAVWQGKNVRLMLTAKKYYNRADHEKAEVPGYIYLRFSSIKAELFRSQH